jgi:hypothetical protein
MTSRGSGVVLDNFTPMHHIGVHQPMCIYFCILYVMFCDVTWAMRICRFLESQRVVEKVVPVEIMVPIQKVVATEVPVFVDKYIKQPAPFDVEKVRSRVQDVLFEVLMISTSGGYQRSSCADSRRKGLD